MVVLKYKAPATIALPSLSKVGAVAFCPRYLSSKLSRAARAASEAVWAVFWLAKAAAALAEALVACVVAIPAWVVAITAWAVEIPAWVVAVTAWAVEIPAWVVAVVAEFPAVVT